MASKISVKYHFNKFPPNNLEWQQLIPLIGSASASLGRYDGLLFSIPNSNILLSPLLLREAVLSSKIEGTEVTMGEVLEIEAGGEPKGITPPKREDANEVRNYREAMIFCINSLSERPLSQSLLRETHALLMQGVRGKDKSPGMYRTDQNWIGTKGCTIETASFVPIAPEHLQAGMDCWEQYLNSTIMADLLVQLALVHLEFEALHPFRDGNGRLGRMLIPIFLYHHKILSSPNFYMSGYLELYREEYQDYMRAVSREDKWTDWVIFFLRGIVDQAKENESKARSILALYNNIKIQVADLTHSQHAIRAVDFLFKVPIFTIPDFVKHSTISKATAARIVNILRNNNIITIIREGKGQRSSIFGFLDLLRIVDN